MKQSFEFVIVHEQLGAHVHMTMYVARLGCTRAKSGNLIMNVEEFAAFQIVCKKANVCFIERKRAEE